MSKMTSGQKIATMLVSCECENCHESFIYEIEVKPRAGVSLEEEKQNRLEKKDFGSKNCPNCNYLQSWMFNAARENRNSMYGGCSFLGTFLFFILLGLFFLLSPSYSMPILLYVVILVIGTGMITFFLYKLLSRMPFKPNKEFDEVKHVKEPEISWKEIRYTEHVEDSDTAYTYPLRVQIEDVRIPADYFSKSGFNLRITDASENIILYASYEGQEKIEVFLDKEKKELFGSINEKGGTYHFITTDGNQVGAVKSAGFMGEMMKPKKVILDANGNEIGTIEKKVGMFSHYGRTFNFNLSGQSVLVIKIEKRGFDKRSFIVEKVGDFSGIEERILLNSLIGLRLLEPSIMKSGFSS